MSLIVAIFDYRRDGKNEANRAHLWENSQCTESQNAKARRTENQIFTRIVLIKNSEKTERSGPLMLTLDYR